MLDRLFPHQQNVARYLPAISHGYAKVAADPRWSCEGLPGTMLDYLRAGGIFRYPATLASAGQVMTESGGLSSASTMITERDPRSSFVVADSGGFQIQQGTLGPWRYQQTVLQSLRWQEAHGDYVMALDFPTGGINTGEMDKHIHRLTHVDGEDLAAMNAANGLGIAFNACMRQTQINTEIMLQHRQPGTRLLVVLQGTSEPESRVWYEAHKGYIADAEGIAFAGTSNTSVRLMLHRLIDMRDDGLLAKIKHIHVLGTGTFESGCVLTTIQRCIRASINPELQITFDTATPFQEANERYRLGAFYCIDNVSIPFEYVRPSGAAKSEYGHHNELSFPINDWCHAQAEDERNRVVFDKLGSYQAMQGRPTAYAAISVIGKTLALNDVAVVRREKDDPDPLNFVIKPTGNTALLMCVHNVDAYTRAMEQVLDRWTKKDREVRNNFPPQLLLIRTLIEMVFAPNHAIGLTDELAELPDMHFDGPLAEVPSPRKGTIPYNAHAFIEEHKARLDCYVKQRA
ncbi:hypothetical protein [Methylobacterium phyllosphaerae]|nr:hypothetical protein [Methylobacterium phyllosphaerae]